MTGRVYQELPSSLYEVGFALSFLHMAPTLGNLIHSVRCGMPLKLREYLEDDIRVRNFLACRQLARSAPCLDDVHRYGLMWEVEGISYKVIMVNAKGEF